MTGQPVPLTPDGFWAALRQPDPPFPIGSRSQGDLEPVQLDLFEPDDLGGGRVTGRYQRCSCGHQREWHDLAPPSACRSCECGGFTRATGGSRTAGTGVAAGRQGRRTGERRPPT